MINRCTTLTVPKRYVSLEDYNMNVQDDTLVSEKYYMVLFIIYFLIILFRLLIIVQLVISCIFYDY